MTLKYKIATVIDVFLAFCIGMMVILLPSIFSNDLMNGTQSGKFFFFTNSVLGILMLWTIGLLFKKELTVKISFLDVLLLLLVGWISLNKYILHDVQAFSLRYYELLGLTVFYMIIRTLPARYTIFLLLSICIGGTIQAVYGNLQLWGYYPSHHGLFKMTGSFFNPGPYAGYLCCILPVAVGLFLYYRKYEFNKQLFEALRLKGLRLTAFAFEKSETLRLMAKPFEKNTHQASSNQTICEEKYQTQSVARSQTQSIEHEVSNVSNIFEQLSFIAIKYIALITIVAILLVLPAARSRAAWLGAIVGVFSLAWHKYNLKQLFKQRSFPTLKPFKHTIQIRNSLLVSILVIVLISGCIALYHYKKDSADGRVLIWTVTANIIKDHPWIGVGQDLFKAHYMDYQADYFRNHPNSKYEMVADDNQYAFNEFLNTWAENGVIGFLLMGGLVFVLFFKGKRVESSKVRKFESLNGNLSNSEASSLSETNIKREASNHSNTLNFEPETILRSSLLAILVFGLFAYPSEILPIKIVVIICLGLLANYLAIDVSNHQTAKPQTLKHSNIQTFFKLAITGFALLLTIGVYAKTNKLQHGYRTWNDAFELYNYGLNSECLEDYAKALPFLQHNGEFMINYGKALSIAEKHEDAIEILGKAKNYQNNTVLCTALGDSQKALVQFNKAEDSYLLASNMAPCKFYSLYLLAKIYDETGQSQKAIELATFLLKKEVKIGSTAIKEIRSEMEKIIERNTEAVRGFNENTTNGQKGKNNHYSPLKIAMVTLPVVPYINKSLTICETNKTERRFNLKKEEIITNRLN